MDDGGVGVLHLLKMSESLLKEIQENVSPQEEIYQYRENFGVIINGDIVQIDNLLTDEIVSVISTKIFTEKLKECINFIKKNYTTEFEQAQGKIHYRKICILRTSFTLLVVILCSMYYIYCRYLDQQKVAYYCIDKQCISIVHLYKDYGINSPTYARIYAGKILFRFQVRTKNYAELLMEDDISISKKILGNKFIIYGSLPVIYGNVDNIEVKEATGYIDRASTDYIVSRNLKFRHLY